MHYSTLRTKVNNPVSSPARSTVILSMAICAMSAWIHADEWPHFRGPDMHPVIEEDPRLPESWNVTENVEWKTDVPGLGWSSPIVWGDRVFLTTVVIEGEFEQPRSGLYMARAHREGLSLEYYVYCFDLESGTILWRTLVHEGIASALRHPKNTYASETPTTDGKRVFALFGDTGLYGLDFDGNLLWNKEINAQKTEGDYGAGASPVVYDDKVIVVYDNEEDSYVAAYDAETGEELWKKSREEKTNWATPFIWKHDLRTEIVTSGEDRIRSYGLDGTLLWDMAGKMSHMTIPTPVASHGMLYVNSGCSMETDRPMYAIRPGANGDISLRDGETSNEFVAWYLPVESPRHPSPLIVGDYLYSLYDEGYLACYDARTGEEIYEKQRLQRRAFFTSSPWSYNGKIFCLSEQGDTFVIKAGKEFELVGRNSLDEMCMASPAVAKGRLLIRTKSKLYSISNNASAKTLSGD